MCGWLSTPCVCVCVYEDEVDEAIGDIQELWGALALWYQGCDARIATRQTRRIEVDAEPSSPAALFFGAFRGR